MYFEDLIFYFLFQNSRLFLDCVHKPYLETPVFLSRKRHEMQITNLIVFQLRGLMRFSISKLASFGCKDFKPVNPLDQTAVKAFKYSLISTPYGTLYLHGELQPYRGIKGKISILPNLFSIERFTQIMPNELPAPTSSRIGLLIFGDYRILLTHFLMTQKIKILR